jgi:hypothetical protein
MEAETLKHGDGEMGNCLQYAFMLKMFAGNFIGNITRFKHNVMNS